MSALETIFADGLIYTHSNAQVDCKGSFLHKLAAGQYIYRDVGHSVDRIVVAGDCAIVSGRMRATVVNSGEERQLENISLAVYICVEGGDWHLLAYQSTMMPK